MAANYKIEFEWEGREVGLLAQELVRSETKEHPIKKAFWFHRIVGPGSIYSAFRAKFFCSETDPKTRWVRVTPLESENPPFMLFAVDLMVVEMQVAACDMLIGEDAKGYYKETQP